MLILRHALLAGTILVPPLALSAQAQKTRDSAGISIVETARRTTAPVALRTGEKPIYDIGGPELDTRYILKVARFSDGRMVVAAQSTLKYFDRDGKFTKSVGRAGAGPEDFRSITAICRIVGDTLLVFDGGNSRFAVLTPTGTFKRLVPRTAYTVNRYGGCLDRTGAFVASGTRGSTLTEETIGTSVEIVGTDGATRANLGIHPSGGRNVLAVWFGEWMANNERVYMSYPMKGEVRILTAAGKLERIVRVDNPKAAVTKAEIDAHLSGLLQGSMSRSGIPTEGVWPAFNSMRISTDGQIWLEDPDRAKPPAWTLIDATGKLISRWTPQVGWRVLGFGRSDVMIQREDADGDRHISVYALVPVK